MALNSLEEKQYAQVYNETCNDIKAFARLVNFRPAGGQRDFCDMVEALTLNPDLYPKQIGVKSGTGTGKTKNLAFLTLWRVWRCPGTFAVNSAPTERQCAEVFFRELKMIVDGSPIVSRMMEVNRAKAHFIGHPQWCIMAATASDENALRGFHHPNLTVSCEEITGMDQTMLGALMRTCSQRENLWMGIFNPDKIVGIAYEMFTSKKEFWPWNLTIDKIRIAQERPDIVDPKIIEIWRKEYGEDSDFWRVGVLGEFPLSSVNGIISQKLINKCKATPIWRAVAGNPNYKHMRVISVDYARFGGDETVIYARSGNAIVHQEILRCEPRDASRAAMEVQQMLGWSDDETVFIIDKVGMGQSQIIYYEEAGKILSGFSPVQRSPIEGYKNRLSAAWFNLQSKMKDDDAYLPDDEILFEQLRTREYTIQGGEILVESKKEYKKRGFAKSPDRADALVMAFAEEDELKETLQDWRVERRNVTQPIQNKLIY